MICSKNSEIAVEGLLCSRSSITVKIYYIANARMPTDKAHGIQLAKMCEAFVEEGVNLELIVPNRKTAEKSIQDFYGIRVPIFCTRLPVFDLYNYGRVGFFISSCMFSVGYFFYLLIKRIKGEKGIIYTIDIDQFSFFLVPLVGMPYFVEVHDAKKNKWPFSTLFKRAKGIIAINLAIQSKIIERFTIQSEKTRAWSNAVDMSMFNKREEKTTVRSKLSLPQDKKIAMYVGRVYAWKGLDILVSAAKQLPNMLFYFVGGTEEEMRHVGAVTTHPPSNLICVGQKPFSEIPFWLWAADVLVVLGTTRNEYSYQHTSPMKLFEYAASHRPIVASKTPAIEQVFSRDEVIYATPDDSHDLAEKISFVCEHPENAERYAESAFRRTDKVFDWRQRARWIIEFISQSK